MRWTALWSVLLLGTIALAGCSSDEGLSVGDRAPDFTLPSASGTTVSLEDFTGTPALLYFHMADG